MELLLTACRLVLFLTFIVAAVSKLKDLKTFHSTLSPFNLPAWLQRWISVGLPFLEAFVALLLVPAATVLWGSLAAGLMIGAFTIVIAVSLIRGYRLTCNCFGQLNSSPINATTLLRNILLLSCAVILVLSYLSPAETRNVLSGLAIALLKPAALWFLLCTLLIALLTAQGALLIFVLRQQGRMMLRIDFLEEHTGAAAAVGQAQSFIASEGLPVGSVAPSFSLPNAQGENISLSDLKQEGRQLILVFSDPACGPCSKMTVGRRL